MCHCITDFMPYLSTAAYIDTPRSARSCSLAHSGVFLLLPRSARSCHSGVFLLKGIVLLLRVGQQLVLSRKCTEVVFVISRVAYILPIQDLLCSEVEPRRGSVHISTREIPPPELGNGRLPCYRIFYLFGGPNALTSAAFWKPHQCVHCKWEHWPLY